jgi:hypothetical protein
MTGKQPHNARNKEWSVKTTFARLFLRSASILVLLAGVAPQLAAQSVQANQNRIVGVWDIQVTNRNCDTGNPVGSFPALHKYELGGTAQVVPATNPARLSAHLGVWRNIRGNDYELAFKMFRFDATGSAIGWVVVKFEVSIDNDETEYQGSGEAQFFDLDGNNVGRSCPSFAGTRLQ